MLSLRELKKPKFILCKINKMIKQILILMALGSETVSHYSSCKDETGYGLLWLKKENVPRTMII